MPTQAEFAQINRLMGNDPRARFLTLMMRSVETTTDETGNKVPTKDAKEAFAEVLADVNRKMEEAYFPQLRRRTRVSVRRIPVKGEGGKPAFMDNVTIEDIQPMKGRDFRLAENRRRRAERNADAQAS